MRKKTAGLLTGILIIPLLLSGCGAAGSSAANEYHKEAAYEEPMAAGEYAEDDIAPASYDEDAEMASSSEGREEPSAQPSGSLREAVENEKIVYSADIRIETLGYSDSVKSLRQKISAAGGFTEMEDESDSNSSWYYDDGGYGTRSLWIVARIPSKNFSSFLDSLEGDGKITSKSVSAQNITKQYADTEATKKALMVEQDRLLGMMEKASTIEEMIAVEQRLSEVERELNAYRTTLDGMDRDVEYSTVNITLKEVKKYSPVTKQQAPYLDRAKEAFTDAIDNFVDFLEGLSLFIIGNFPFLIILGLIIVLMIKVIKRKRAEKTAIKPSDKCKKRGFFRKIDSGKIEEEIPQDSPEK